MSPDRIILVVCVVAFTALAAVTDWRFKKLPNKLTVSAFVAALLFHLIYGFASNGALGAGQQLLFALAGFGTGFGILFVLWLIGGGGGGDVKFMGALGAWLGAVLTFQVFIVSAILIAFGGILVFAWGFIDKGMMRTRERYLEKNEEPRNENDQQRQRVRRRLMPFGVPAALATWVVLFFSEFVLK
ncbi:MAG: A24 family peptidase [Planctomycetota bacterium]